MKEKLLRSFGIALGSFFVLYVGLVILYVLFYAFAARNKALEPVPIFIAAIPVAVFGALVALIFSLFWSNRN